MKNFKTISLLSLVLLFSLSSNIFCMKRKRVTEGDTEERKRPKKKQKRSRKMRQKYLVSGSDDGTINIWDISTGKLIKTLIGHTKNSSLMDRRVTSLVFHPEYQNIIASGSFDGTIKIWYIDQGRALKTLIGDAGSVISVAFHPKADIIVSGYRNGKIKIWDILQERVLRTLNVYEGMVCSVAFHPENPNIIISGSDDGTINIWDISKKRGRELIKTFKGHKGGVCSVAFHPIDSNIIASGSCAVKIWDITKVFDNIERLKSGEKLCIQKDIVSSLRLIKRFRGPTGSVISVVFHPENPNIVASGFSDGTVKIWDISKQKDKELIQDLVGHAGSVKSVVFHPENLNIIASGSTDKTVKIRNISTTDEQIETLVGHGSMVTSVAFQPMSQEDIAKKAYLERLREQADEHEDHGPQQGKLGLLEDLEMME